MAVQETKAKHNEMSIELRVNACVRACVCVCVCVCVWIHCNNLITLVRENDV